MIKEQPDPLPLPATLRNASDMGKAQAGARTTEGVEQPRVAIDTETFKDKKIQLRQSTPEFAREKLAVAERTPETLQVAKTLTQALSGVTTESGPLAWGFFGSFAYQIDAQSLVVQPDDIDGFFDGDATDQVYEALEALHQSGQITTLHPKAIIPSTGATLISGVIEFEGRNVDFELFGQNMSNPQNKNGYVNVGAGDRAYTVSQLPIDDSNPELLMNIIDAKGQVELYLRRILVEFQQGIGDVGANTFKHKVAFRLFRIMRLLGAYESEDFMETLAFVANEEREKRNVSELRALRDLQGMYGAFQDLLSEMPTEDQSASMPIRSMDDLEAELVEFGELSTREAAQMREHYDQLQLLRSKESFTLADRELVEEVMVKTELIIADYTNQLLALQDARMFAMYAQVQQALENFAFPLADEVLAVRRLMRSATDPEPAAA